MKYILLLLFIIVSSCGNTQTTLPGQSGCASDTVLIGVGDGYIQNLCGCNETPGTTSNTENGFTCTFSNGKNIVFQFLGTKQRHQILSTSGGKTFPTTPISDPESNAPVYSFTITINETGTYPFSDVFNSLISGQLISQ